MYLTSWEEQVFVADEIDILKNARIKTFWKGYSFDVINKLTNENYLYFSKGKSASLTPKGELIGKYNKR